MLAECSPGDYQQRIRRFKIKRPFSFKIDIGQKEWPRLIFAEQLGCGAEPVSDLSDSIYPNYCTAMSNVAPKFFARPNGGSATACSLNGFRLPALRLSQFAACSGAPSHLPAPRLKTTQIFKVALQQGFATGEMGSMIDLRRKNS
jgi:hypothetical protein